MLCVTRKKNAQLVFKRSNIANSSRDLEECSLHSPPVNPLSSEDTAGIRGAIQVCSHVSAKGPPLPQAPEKARTNKQRSR